MPLFRLPAHVHAVAVRDDLVFLDLTSDYLCLVGAGEVVTLGPDGSLHADDPEMLAPLLEAGLAERGPALRRRTPPPRPQRDTPHGARGGGPQEVRAACQAMLATGLDLVRLDLRALVDKAGRRAEPHPPAHTQDVVEAAQLFTRLRVWSPVGGQCLARSYMMLDFLRRLGLDADWVIGVRTWPFMAHCWLQAGDVVLDDDVERLAAYTPLMVV